MRISKTLENCYTPYSTKFYGGKGMSIKATVEKIIRVITNKDAAEAVEKANTIDDRVEKRANNSKHMLDELQDLLGRQRDDRGN